MGPENQISKIKVCCFCERWESGGIESFLYNILTRLDLTQFQVDIVCASLGKSVFTKPLQDLGIHFFELSGSQRKIKENHRQFQTLMRERHWNVLYLNAFQGLTLSYLHLAKNMGIPVRIAHSHNTALRQSPTRSLKQVLHAWTRARYSIDATDLWACSQEAAKFLFSKKQLKQKNFQFIPNGIDTIRFRFNPTVRDIVRAKLGLTGQFVIGNVGRLCYQKNQSFLLDVFTEVLRNRSNSLLLLIGEGENKVTLQEKARQLGITNNVIFYGVTDCVEHLLWAMDVFVFPSLFEGLGIAVIEAQAAGLPVIASESVPIEANLIKEWYYVISIKNGIKKWADAALTFAESSFSRECAADIVRAKGFDVTEAAHLISHRFCAR